MAERKVKLYTGKAIVVTQAQSKKEAKSKIFDKLIIVDDVTDIERDRMEHIEDQKRRKKNIKRIKRALRLIEQRTP